MVLRLFRLFRLFRLLASLIYTHTSDPLLACPLAVAKSPVILHSRTRFVARAGAVSKANRNSPADSAEVECFACRSVRAMHADS